MVGLKDEGIELGECLEHRLTDLTDVSRHGHTRATRATGHDNRHRFGRVMRDPYTRHFERCVRDGPIVREHDAVRSHTHRTKRRMRARAGQHRPAPPVAGLLQAVDVIRVFVRDRHAGDAFRRDADAAQARGERAWSQPTVYEQPFSGRLDDQRVRGAAAGEDPDVHRLNYLGADASVPTHSPRPRRFASSSR